MLVCALPSAHAAAPPTPITGFADVHVHQFANLGFGGLVVWGQSFTPDNSIETALPWDDWTPGHFGDVVDKNGNAGRDDLLPESALPQQVRQASEVLGADCAPGTGVRHLPRLRRLRRSRRGRDRRPRQRLLERLARSPRRRLSRVRRLAPLRQRDEPGRLLRLAPPRVRRRAAADGDARRQQRGALQGGQPHRARTGAPTCRPSTASCRPPTTWRRSSTRSTAAPARAGIASSPRLSRRAR